MVTPATSARYSPTRPAPPLLNPVNQENSVRPMLLPKPVLPAREKAPSLSFSQTFRAFGSLTNLKAGMDAAYYYVKNRKPLTQQRAAGEVIDSAVWGGLFAHDSIHDFLGYVFVSLILKPIFSPIWAFMQGVIKNHAHRLHVKA